MTVSYEFTTMHIRPDNFTICIFAITIRMISGAWINSWSNGLLFAWRSRDMEFLHVVAAIAFAEVTILCDKINDFARWQNHIAGSVSVPTGAQMHPSGFLYHTAYSMRHFPFYFMREFKGRPKSVHLYCWARSQTSISPASLSELFITVRKFCFLWHLSTTESLRNIAGFPQRLPPVRPAVNPSISLLFSYGLQ